MNALRERLKGPLPGPEVWLRWTSRNNPQFSVPADARQAGVLICLYRREEDFYLPVMQRPARTGPHSGQISLPGGAHEPEQDPSLVDTALREAQEEMGIERFDLDILGTLTPLYIPVSGFLVHPVVATARRIPVFVADPVEVERIIEVPVSALLNRENQSITTFHFENDISTKNDTITGSHTITAPSFRIGSDIIWGATAMILAEFLQVFEESSQRSR